MKLGTYQEMARIESDHWWFRGRRAIIRSQIARLALPDTARILEVGCGTGGNLGMLSEFGEVLALEPEKSAHKLIAAKSNVVVREGRLPADELPFEQGSFTLLFPLIVLIRAWHRLNGKTVEYDTIPAPWLNTLLYQVFASERFPLRFLNLPFGVSIVLIAQR